MVVIRPPLLEATASHGHVFSTPRISDFPSSAGLWFRSVSPMLGVLHSTSIKVRQNRSFPTFLAKFKGSSGQEPARVGNALSRQAPTERS